MMQNNSICENKIRYKELHAFFIWLSDNKIPYSVVKGEALSLAAYGELGQRQSCDIDFLFSIKDIAAVKTELINLGFFPKNNNRLHEITAISSTNQSLPYIKEKDGLEIEIDINHDIFWGEYTGKRIDIETFLTDTDETMVYGNKIKTLKPLNAIIQLILHHYHDFNSIYRLSCEKCIGIRMLRDVYFLWKNNKKAISDNLCKVSFEYEIAPYVHNILYYTNMIYRDHELEAIIKTIETPEGIYLLNCYGLTDKERKTWKVDFFERLNESDVYKFIKDDMSTEDIEKIKRAEEIFG